jgi:hypothetical protein
MDLAFCRVAALHISVADAGVRHEPRPLRCDEVGL